MSKVCLICKEQPFIRPTLSGYKIYCPKCKIIIKHDSIDEAFKVWDIIMEKKNDE
jgi:transcription initiation factor TFIIIB Brf1 subunit/transcription initiation factor TFIIB